MKDRNKTKDQLIKELQESVKKYNLLIENLQEGIWVIDKDAYTTFVNPRMAEMLGYTIEEMIGKHLFSFMDEQGIEIAKRNIERRKQGIKEQHDFEFLRKNGTQIYVNLSTSPLIENGIYLGAIAGVIDITERRQMEEKIRKNEEYLLLQINRMPIGYIVWDSEFRVISWNPEAEQIFGFIRDEVVGKHPYDLIVPKDMQPHVDTIWHRLLEGDNTAHSINENITKDARSIICEWTNTPQRKDKTVIGVLSMVQDITERKRFEEKIKQKLDEVERMNKLMVGRELKMEELRKEIQSLKLRIKEFEKRG